MDAERKVKASLDAIALDPDNPSMRALAERTIISLLAGLLDAAEAVLDSDCGTRSLAELAEAVHAVDSQRDHRDRYPR